MMCVRQGVLQAASVSGAEEKRLCICYHQIGSITTKNDPCEKKFTKESDQLIRNIPLIQKGKGYKRVRHRMGFGNHLFSLIHSSRRAAGCASNTIS